MEKVKNLLQKLWQNEKVRIGVISYLIFYIVCLYFTTNIMSTEEGVVNFIESCAECTLCVIIYSLLLIIEFIPALIIIHFLFKKLKNTKLRLVLTCLMFPLLNCFCLVIEHFCMSNENFISTLVGLITLAVAFPIILLVCACSPKAILTNKKWKLLTVFLTGMIWMVMFGTTEWLVDNVDHYLDRKALDKCETIINNIEKYKEDNGSYPTSIKEELPTKRFYRYSYTLENNNKDYVFTLKNKIYEEYLYCTDKNSEYCKIETTRRGRTEPFGKWVKFTEFD